MQCLSLILSRFFFVGSILVCLIVSHADELKAQPNKIFGRIVFVIPNGAEPPKGYEQKIRSVAIRTESFFVDWMAYWDYPIEREHFFTRNSKGKTHIELVKATLPRKVEGSSVGRLKDLAIKHARAKTQLGKKHKAVWWVFIPTQVLKVFMVVEMRTEAKRSTNILQLTKRSLKK